MEYCVGNGVDVHPLVEGRKLILGGVHIPHDYGCDGHSDGDVLIHSIIDALLGALSKGDIGDFFPSTDKDAHPLSGSFLPLIDFTENLFSINFLTNSMKDTSPSA